MTLNVISLNNPEVTPWGQWIILITDKGLVFSICTSCQLQHGVIIYRRVERDKKLQFTQNSLKILANMNSWFCHHSRTTKSIFPCIIKYPKWHQNRWLPASTQFFFLERVLEQKKRSEMIPARIWPEFRFDLFWTLLLPWIPEVRKNLKVAGMEISSWFSTPFPWIMHVPLVNEIVGLKIIVSSWGEVHWALPSDVNQKLTHRS